MLYPKIQQTKDRRYKNLALSVTAYEGRLKIILLLQVSSHDFEPTFFILVLIYRILPDSKNKSQTFDT